MLAYTRAGLLVGMHCDLQVLQVAEVFGEVGRGVVPGRDHSPGREAGLGGQADVSRSGRISTHPEDSALAEVPGLCTPGHTRSLAGGVASWAATAGGLLPSAHLPGELQLLSRRASEGCCPPPGMPMS